jgi:hypothetical protein
MPICYTSTIVMRDKDMFYENLISKRLGISMEVARNLTKRMSIAGFDFSESSEEQIVSEATFLLKLV